MTPPASAQIYETSTSTYWFERDILFVIAKKITAPDTETQKRELEELKARTSNKKIYGIMDINDASPSSKEMRDHNAVELPKIFNAVAFIIRNPVSRMIAHLYLGAKPMEFAIKMFSNESEARAWIASIKKTRH